MREKEIENRLVSEVKKLGGMCLKWESSSMVGVPDRIVLLPGCPPAFVELKAPGRKPRAIQEVRHSQMRALGCKVLVIDKIEQIRGAIHEIQSARLSELRDKVH